MVRKVAAFDVIGTCFGFSNIVQAIEEEFGAELKQAGTTSSHVMTSWYTQATRDFTFLSVSEQYTPTAKVFEATLPRVLATALDPSPQYPSISRVTTFPEDKLKRIVAELPKLPARPGLVDAFGTLQKAGFEVYAVSNGSKQTVQGLFGAVDSPRKPEIFTSSAFETRIVSCDDLKTAKPSPQVYRHALDITGADPAKGDICWFIAAHSWDLLSARKAGFKTGYVTFEEIVGCEEIFGKPDATEDGLAKLAKTIVDQSS